MSVTSAVRHRQQQLVPMVWGFTTLCMVLGLCASLATAASPLPMLQRLGTSVEARILSLATTDLPRTDLEFNTIIGITKRINANMIFVELLDDSGHMVYPSKVWPHRETGPDRLQTLIDKAHSEGIHVVPWIKTFFATASGELGPVLGNHPEWAAVGSDGSQITSYNMAWFNPAHPDARAFIQRAIMELVTDYDIDGLQLDYIRYPNSEFPTLYSYDDYSRAIFQQETGIDSLQLQTPGPFQLTAAGVTLESLPPQWQQWTVWRENQVTTFVSELVSQVRSSRPDLPLFFGVIPALWSGSTYPNARFLLNQHWAQWVEAGYVDGVTPPTYTNEDHIVQREVGNVRSIATEHAIEGPVFVYPSLMVYPDPGVLVREIELLRAMGIPGVRLFSYGRMGLPHFRALWEGPFAEPAVIPHEKPFVSALHLVSEVVEVLRQGAVTGQVGEAVGEALGPLQLLLNQVTEGYPSDHTVRRAGITPERAEELEALVEATLTQVALALTSEDPSVHQSVMQQLHYARTLIEYGLSVEGR